LREEEGMADWIDKHVEKITMDYLSQQQAA
jgi:hypothetical protein